MACSTDYSHHGFKNTPFIFFISILELDNALRVRNGCGGQLAHCSLDGGKTFYGIQFEISKSASQLPNRIVSILFHQTVQIERLDSIFSSALALTPLKIEISPQLLSCLKLAGHIFSSSLHSFGAYSYLNRSRASRIQYSFGF